MSDPEYQTDGLRRAKVARVSLVLTAVLTVMNIIGLGSFWLTLPERVSAMGDQLTDHQTRITSLESKSAVANELLGRIDERTKNMQDSSRDIKDRINEIARKVGAP